MCGFACFVCVWKCVLVCVCVVCIWVNVVCVGLCEYRGRTGALSSGALLALAVVSAARGGAGSGTATGSGAATGAGLGLGLGLWCAPWSSLLESLSSRAA